MSLPCRLINPANKKYRYDLLEESQPCTMVCFADVSLWFSNKFEASVIRCRNAVFTHRTVTYVRFKELFLNAKKIYLFGYDS